MLCRDYDVVRLPNVRELKADEAAESGPGHGPRQPGLGQQPGKQVHVIRMLVNLLQPEQQNSIKDDILTGGFFGFFLFSMNSIQHCFICRPSDSTVSEDAGIEPRTVATSALAVRRSNH